MGMETLDVGSGPHPKGTVNVDLNRKFKPTVVAEARSQTVSRPCRSLCTASEETESPLQQLEKLSKLEEADVITEEEFQEKKKDIS